MNIKKIILLKEAEHELKKLKNKYKSFTKDYERFEQVCLNEDLFHEVIFKKSKKDNTTNCNKRAFYKYKKFREFFE